MGWIDSPEGQNEEEVGRELRDAAAFSRSAPDAVSSLSWTPWRLVLLVPCFAACNEVRAQLAWVQEGRLPPAALPSYCAPHARRLCCRSAAPKHCPKVTQTPAAMSAPIESKAKEQSPPDAVSCILVRQQHLAAAGLPHSCSPGGCSSALSACCGARSPPPIAGGPRQQPGDVWHPGRRDQAQGRRHAGEGVWAGGLGHGWTAAGRGRRGDDEAQPRPMPTVPALQLDR